MILFYSPDIRTSGILPPEESAHCVRVLRHKTGDLINVIDGKGFLFNCEIIVSDPKRTEVKIISEKKENHTWENRICIAVAPPKNSERLDWLVEKVVEVGVDEIIPVVCKRSERKQVKEERLQKIVISAMKQSLKAYLPKLHSIMSFSDLMEYAKAFNNKFIAYCDETLGKSYLCRVIGNSDTLIVIGPEGDFTPEEVETAMKRGFQPVSLGESRLRTETAALTALQTFHIIMNIKQNNQQ